MSIKIDIFASSNAMISLEKLLQCKLCGIVEKFS